MSVPKFGFENKELLKDFFVVTMISNPVRYRSRYRIYEQWQETLALTGAKLVTVELAFGERPFEVTEEGNAFHIRLRSEDELWHKENALNIAIQYICQHWSNAKYFAWIDADTFSMRPNHDWLLETFHQLQHYQFVQMFEYAQDLDPEFNPLGRPQQSFMSSYIKSGYTLPDTRGHWYYYGHGHPGYAWAATRDALNKVGGLIDIAILGAADRHMAMGLIQSIEHSFPSGITEDYKAELMQWQERARKHIRLDVGFVPGGIYHYWHGKKKQRGYSDRWKILVNNGYAPNSDLKRDAQGLWQLEDNDERQIRLRDEVRRYFRSRSEDSIDVT